MALSSSSSSQSSSSESSSSYSLVQGTHCWGEDYGTEEEYVWEFSKGSGSGQVTEQDGEERIHLSQGKDWISNIVRVPTNKREVRLNKYGQGLGIAPEVYKKEGSTKANCDADTWTRVTLGNDVNSFRFTPGTEWVQLRLRMSSSSSSAVSQSQSNSSSSSSSLSSESIGSLSSSSESSSSASESSYSSSQSSESISPVGNGFIADRPPLAPYETGGGVSFGANWCYAQRFTVPGSGTKYISEIGVGLDTEGNQSVWKLAIYADNGSGTYPADTNPITNSISDEFSEAVTEANADIFSHLYDTLPQVQGGDRYWIAIYTDDSNIDVYRNSSGPSDYARRASVSPYDAWPTEWSGTAIDVSSYDFQLYALYQDTESISSSSSISSYSSSSESSSSESSSSESSSSASSESFDSYSSSLSSSSSESSISNSSSSSESSESSSSTSSSSSESSSSSSSESSSSLSSESSISSSSSESTSGAYFSEGFQGSESGYDNAGWSEDTIGLSTIDPDSTTVTHPSGGTQTLELDYPDDSDARAFTQYSFGEYVTEIYTRVYFYVPTGSLGGSYRTILTMNDSSANEIMYGQIKEDSGITVQLRVRNNSAWSTIASDSLAYDTWHYIELHYDVAAATDHAQARINGSAGSETNLTGVYYTDGVYQVRLGCDKNLTRDLTVYFDLLEVSEDAYPGSV